MQKKQIIKLFVVVIFSFLLSACANTTKERETITNPLQDEKTSSQNISKQDTEMPTAADPEKQSAYPKTIMVQGKEVTINSQPKRIAVLSLDAAEAVLEIGGSQHVVAIPKSSTDPALAYRTEEAVQVKHKIASATSLDPEQVLSFEPDLIIMTKVHSAEQDADQLLKQAGIPLISLDPWNTIEQLWTNYELIGKAIGEEERAKQIIDEMKDKVTAVQSALEGVSKPSVLIISPLGPGTGPYIIGKSNISYDIVRRAGGNNSADDLGLTRVTKASMEQIMKADPDYILLIQWKEGDTSDLEAITNTAGWKSLKAVQQGNVKSMTVKQIFYPNRYNVDSLGEIARWLHPERFQSSK